MITLVLFHLCKELSLYASIPNTLKLLDTASKIHDSIFMSTDLHAVFYT